MAKKIGVDSWIAFFALVGLCGLGWYAVKLRLAHGDLVESAHEQETALGTEKKKSVDLQAQLTKCIDDGAAAKTQTDIAAKSAADATATLTATQGELADLRAQRAEADARLAEFKAVTEKLKKMIDSGKLKVEIRNGRMIVKLPAGILFASGSAELSKDGQGAIGDVAAILKQFPDRRFEVAGHTDNVPLGPSPFKDNWELSTARAVTVTEQLIKAGMNPTKLIASGYAQFAPVRENSTEAGRQENRRIELVLLPNLAEIPGLVSANAGNVAATTKKK
jgi:chemotaxis protein MotB